jgi:peptide/nickel transport system permease protein
MNSAPPGLTLRDRGTVYSALKVGQEVRTLARRQPMGVVGAVVLAVMIAAAIFPGVVTSFGRDETVTFNYKAGPLHVVDEGEFIGSRLWLGSDTLGRDMLTRLIYGGRISLLIGLTAPLIGITLGSLIGIVGAYLGGVVDMTVQRLVDAMMAIPGVVLAMALIITLGFSVQMVIIAIGVTLIGDSARVMRAHVLSLREFQYIESARSIGASEARIIVTHIIPNSWAPYLVLFSVAVASTILIESGLSFLGVGVQPPTPTWGNMLQGAQLFLRSAPHSAILPGLAMSITVLSINVLGDAIRDILDPKLRGAR